MNTSRKLLLAGAASAVAIALFTAPGHADGGFGRHHDRGAAAEFGPGPLESFDRNGDGKLTQAEIDETRRERFAKFDKNGDGKLTLEEFESLWKDFMRTRMVRSFQALDEDGDGAVTGQEYLKPMSRLVQRLDRNGDGEATADELRHTGGHGRMRDR